MYISAIPNDLNLELSLYLNYQDTLVYCQFLGFGNTIWLYKIRKELGYDNNFINEYVYNSTNQEQRSLLLPNEKYLELKARTSVDFGTEFYQDYNVLIMRSSRLSDFQLADQLTQYLLNVVKYTSTEEYKKNYKVAIRGAVAAKNILLVDKLLNSYYQDKLVRNINEDFAQSIIPGIYESYPNGNPELFKHFDINVLQITQAAIVQGLSAGGHLELMKKFPINTDGLNIAISLKRLNIIQHYDLIKTYPSAIRSIIMYGYLDLIPDINASPQHIIEQIVQNLMTDGYIHEGYTMKKYSDLITASIVKIVVCQIVIINHLDTFNYIFRRFPDIVKEELLKKFDTAEGFLDTYDITSITWSFLYRNNLITQKQINLIPDIVLYKMSKSNIEALTYLMQFLN